MTAETIVKTILNVINLKKDTINLSGSDNDLIQIKEFLNETGVELTRRIKWNALLKTATTLGNVSTHILPTDFQQLSETQGIVLNKTSYTPVRLLKSKALWLFIKRNTSVINYAIINNNSLDFSKNLDTSGAIFYYFSKNWVAGNKAEITENADILLIPETLFTKGAIWRWKREKGLQYNDELAEYEALVKQEYEASMGD